MSVMYVTLIFSQRLIWSVSYSVFNEHKLSFLSLSYINIWIYFMYLYNLSNCFYFLFLCFYFANFAQRNSVSGWLSLLPNFTSYPLRWAQVDSNHRPRAYQARALTNWAMSPCEVFPFTPLLYGDDGIRTHDPLLAGQVLSQLSYTPICDAGSVSSASSFAHWKLNNILSCIPYSYQMSFVSDICSSP